MQMKATLSVGLLLLAPAMMSGRSAPAHAYAQDTGYAITLSYSGAGTIPFGDSTGAFTADFIHPTTKPSNGESVDLYVDSATGTAYGGDDQYISPTEDSIYFPGVSGLSVGTHHFQAKYYLTTTSTWIISNILTVTVGKGTIAMTCGFAMPGPGYTFAPGQTLLIAMSVNATSGNGPVDWQQGTFTVIFKGPVQVTESNLTANTQEQVTVQAPQTTGDYQVICQFDGSPNYSGGPGYGFSIGTIISQQHKTGPIRLYSNPTTVQPNQPFTFYVVIPAGNGLPTPTGSFDINIANSSSRPIPLRADGTVMVQGTAPNNVYGTISILYFGDGVYNSEVATFPLTNPPIPSPTGGSGSGTPTPTVPATQATATPADVASPTPSVVATGTPTAANPTNSRPTTPQSGIPSAMPVLIGGGSAAIVLSGIGGIFVMRRRKMLR
jgi:hypothetical protein